MRTTFSNEKVNNSKRKQTNSLTNQPYFSKFTKVLFENLYVKRQKKRLASLQSNNKCQFFETHENKLIESMNRALSHGYLTNMNFSQQKQKVTSKIQKKQLPNLIITKQDKMIKSQNHSDQSKFNKQGKNTSVNFYKLQKSFSQNQFKFSSSNLSKQIIDGDQIKFVKKQRQNYLLKSLKKPKKSNEDFLKNTLKLQLKNSIKTNHQTNMKSLNNQQKLKSFYLSENKIKLIRKISNINQQIISNNERQIHKINDNKNQIIKKDKKSESKQLKMYTKIKKNKIIINPIKIFIPQSGQGFIDITQQMINQKNRNPQIKSFLGQLNKQILIGGKKITISYDGILISYIYYNNKEQKYRNILESSDEFLTHEQYMKRYQFLLKLSRNTFFYQFKLNKYFRLWKILMKNAHYSEIKKQIFHLKYDYTEDYFRNLLRYRQIIIKGYMLIQNNGNIFSFKDKQLQKIQQNKYKDKIINLFQKKINFDIKQFVIKDISILFINRLRQWFLQLNLQKSKFIAQRQYKTQKIRQNNSNKQKIQIKQQNILIQQKIMIKSNQQQANKKDKLKNYKQLQQSKFIPQQNGFFQKQKQLNIIFQYQNHKVPMLQFESYEIRLKIEKQKKLLKKIISMQQQQKVNFIFRFLDQISHKFYLNFMHFKRIITNCNEICIIQNYQKFKQRTINKRVHKKINKNVKVKFQLQDNIKSQLQNNDNKRANNIKNSNKTNNLIMISIDNDNQNIEYDNNILCSQINNLLQSFNNVFKHELQNQKISNRLIETRIQMKQFYNQDTHEILLPQILIKMTLQQDMNNQGSDQYNNVDNKIQGIIFNKSQQQLQSNIIKNINELFDCLIDQYSKNEFFSNENSNKKETNFENSQSIFYIPTSNTSTKQNILLSEYHSKLEFLNNFALNSKINKRQFQIINQTINSTDQYYFLNILKSKSIQINKIKNNIHTVIKQNYKCMVIIRKRVSSILKQVKQKLNQKYNEFQVSSFYQMMIRFYNILDNTSYQINIGNFVLSYYDIIQHLKTILSDLKILINNTAPERFNNLYQGCKSKLLSYKNQILLSAYGFQQFIKSYKKTVQFDQQAQLIRKNIQEIHNLLSLINIIHTKMYQTYYMKYLQLRDLNQKVKLNKIKFQQSISIKLKMIQPQKDQLAKYIQKQLDLVIKKLFSIIQKQKLDIKKAYQDILQLNKKIQEYQIIKHDLQLIQNLQITYCLKSEQVIYFHSFAKTKNQISYIINLLNSYQQFQKSILQQLSLNYIHIKAQYYLQKIQKQRAKVKHSTKILYQFETFIFNCYCFYQKYKKYLQLLSLIKKLDHEDLQSIGQKRKLFNFTNKYMYTGIDIFNMNFTSEQQKYLLNLIKKKLFVNDSVHTLSQIQKQISTLKLITKKLEFQNQNDQQIIFTNIQQNINLIVSYTNKISSFKQTKFLASTSKNTHNIIQRIDSILNFLNLLNQKQIYYIELNKIFNNCSSQQIIRYYRTADNKNNLFLACRQNTKKLWLDLIQILKDSYIDNILSFQPVKLFNLINQLKQSLEKQHSLIKNLILKKKQQFPLFHLFDDLFIISQLSIPTNFLKYYFDFVNISYTAIQKNHFNLHIKTIYDQQIKIQLKKLNQNQLKLLTLYSSSDNDNKNSIVQNKINQIDDINNNNIQQQNTNKNSQFDNHKHILINNKQNKKSLSILQKDQQFLHIRKNSSDYQQLYLKKQRFNSNESIKQDNQANKNIKQNDIVEQNDKLYKQLDILKKDNKQQQIIIKQNKSNKVLLQKDKISQKQQHQVKFNQEQSQQEKKRKIKQQLQQNLNAQFTLGKVFNIIKKQIQTILYKQYLNMIQQKQTKLDELLQLSYPLSTIYISQQIKNMHYFKKIQKNNPPLSRFHQLMIKYIQQKIRQSIAYYKNSKNIYNSYHKQQMRSSNNSVNYDINRLNLNNNKKNSVIINNLNLNNRLSQVNNRISQLQNITEGQDYNKHLFNMLILSKLQFRNKLQYSLEQSNGLQSQYQSFIYNFFSYDFDNQSQKTGFRCFNQKQYIYYNLVDSMKISPIQPLNQKVNIYLFKLFHSYKYGILQNSSDLLNIASRLLHYCHKISYLSSKKIIYSVQNLIKISMKTQITFILEQNIFNNSNSLFLTQSNKIFNFVNQIKFLKNKIVQNQANQKRQKLQLAVNKQKSNNINNNRVNNNSASNKDKLKQKDLFKKLCYIMSKQILCINQSLTDQQLIFQSIKQMNYPSIFIQSKNFSGKLSSNKIQFQNISMIKQMRVVQYSKPSVSFIIQLILLRNNIKINNNIKYLIIQKIKQLQIKFYQSQSYLLKRLDIQRIIDDLIIICKDNYPSLDEQNVQIFFLTYSQLNQSLNQIPNKNNNKQKKSSKNQDKELEPSKKYQKSLKSQLYEQKQMNLDNKNKNQYNMNNQTAFELMLLFNSIKKSFQLANLYKQFHECLQKTNKSVILYGDCFTGKSTFYRKYIDCINNYAINKKSLTSVNRIQQIQIDGQIDKSFDYIAQFNYWRVKMLIQQNLANTKKMIILKNFNKYNNKLQQIVLYNKLIIKQQQPLSLNDIHIVLQARQLKQLSPNIIINCKRLYFNQKTVDWYQILLERGKQIIKRFTLNNKYQYRNKQQFNYKQSNKPYNSLQQQQIQIIQTGTFQVFNNIFTDFFKQINFKDYFVIQVNVKYLISTTLSLTLGIFIQYQKPIQKYYQRLVQQSKSKQNSRDNLIRKIFVYSFYWTCYWILQKPMLKSFDTLFRQSLSKYQISLKDVKFLYVLLFRAKTVQMLHIKSLDSQIIKSKRNFGYNQSKVSNIQHCQKNNQNFKYTQKQVNNTNNNNNFNYNKQQIKDNYQIYVQSYQTYLYKHFIKSLSASQTNIIIFGQQRIGKSALIKSFLKNQTHYPVIIKMIHPYKSYQTIIQKILQNKNQVELQKKRQFLNQTLSRIQIGSKKSSVKAIGNTSKKLILSRNNFKTQNHKQQKLSSIKTLNYLTTQKQINEPIHNQINNYSLQIRHIFIQDINLSIDYYQNLLQYIRQYKQVPYRKNQPNNNLNLNDSKQYCFFNINKLCLIRRISLVEAQKMILKKYQHYYPLHVFFQDQAYWQQAFNNIFQIILKKNFVDFNQTSSLIKNRCIISRTFLKFHHLLQNIFSGKGSLIRLQKQNHLIKFKILDTLKLLKCLNNQNIQYKKGFYDNCKILLKIFFSYKLTTSQDLIQFQRISRRFLLDLADALSLKITVSQNQYKKIQIQGQMHQYNSQMHKNIDAKQYNTKQNFIPFNPSFNKQDGQKKKSQQILMKSVQYQNKNTSFHFNQTILQNLVRIQQCLKVKNLPILILNKIILQNNQSFIKFSCDFFGYHNLHIIDKLSELNQYFNQKGKQILQYQKLIKNEMSYVLQKKNIKLGRLKYENAKITPSNINNDSTSSNPQYQILYIRHTNFINWQRNLQTINYYLFQLEYFEKILNLPRYENRFKIIIQYSQFDQRTSKTLRINTKQLLLNSNVVLLSYITQKELKLDKINKYIIKNQKFDGDYQKALQISKLFILIYNNLQKLIRTYYFKQQDSIQIQYLFSIQNFQRFLQNFVQIYYHRQITLKTFINLLSSGIGQINNILQQFNYKKGIYIQLRKQIYDQRVKYENLKQKKKILQNSIQYFQKSQSYQIKLTYLEDIQKKKTQIKNLHTRKNNLKGKSNYYSNFLTRQQLAQLKYLFLNSYDSTKQLFQAITLILLDECPSEKVKKVILDINLLAKLKQLNFLSKSQQILTLARQKLQQFSKDKQDKANSMNFYLWIFYTVQYYLSLYTNKTNVKKIQQQIKQQENKIKQIQQKQQISDKVKQIQQLQIPLKAMTDKLTSLTIGMQQIQPLFKIQKQVNSMYHFSLSSKQIKQQLQKQYSYLFLSSLYIAMWINFGSFFHEDSKVKDFSHQPKIDTFLKGFADLILKKSNIQNVNKDTLIQNFRKKTEQVLFNYINENKKAFQQKKMAHQITGKIFQDLATKNKSQLFDIHKNQKKIYNENKNKNLWKNSLFSSQIKTKMFIILFMLIRSQRTKIVLLDNENLLIPSFTLSAKNKFLLKKQKIPQRHNKINNLLNSSKINNQKYLQAYITSQSYLCKYCPGKAFIFIKVPDNQWSLSYEISDGKMKKQKLIRVKIGKYFFSNYIEISDYISSISVIFVKRKYSNLNQLTFQFFIISFSSPIQRHEKQILINKIMQQPLDKKLMYQIMINNQNQNSDTLNISFVCKQILKNKDYQQILKSYFDKNIYSVIKNEQHLSQMHNIHKILCQSSIKLSIHEKDFLMQIHSKVSDWLRIYEQYSSYYNIFMLYQKFVKLNYNQFINKLIDIYKAWIKAKQCLDEFYYQNQKQQIISDVHIHYKFIGSQFMNIFQESKQYIRLLKLQEIQLPIEQQILLPKLSSLLIQLSLIQAYFIYRLSLQQHGVYIMTLIYVYIYALQNQDSSIIDIKNLVHTNNTVNDITSLLNSQSSYYYIQMFKYLPGNKFQFENFFRKLVKQCKTSNNIKLDNINKIIKYIQNFSYQNRIIQRNHQQNSSKQIKVNNDISQNNGIKQSRQKSIDSQFTLQFNKLSKFSQFLLKKHLVPQIFYQQIYNTTLQKININRQLFDSYLQHNKIWLQFCNIQHIYQYIKQNYMFKNNKNSYKIQIIQLYYYKNQIKQYFYELISEKQNDNTNRLLLIFDFRFKYLNSLSVQSYDRIQSFYLDYLKINKNHNIIIFIDQNYHESYHKLQIKLKSISLLINYSESQNNQQLSDKPVLNQNITFGILATTSKTKTNFNNFTCCSLKMIIQKITLLIYEFDINQITQDDNQQLNKKSTFISHNLAKIQPKILQYIRKSNHNKTIHFKPNYKSKNDTPKNTNKFIPKQDSFNKSFKILLKYFSNFYESYNYKVQQTLKAVDLLLLCRKYYQLVIQNSIKKSIYEQKIKINSSSSHHINEYMTKDYQYVQLIDFAIFIDKLFYVLQSSKNETISLYRCKSQKQIVQRVKDNILQKIQQTYINSIRYKLSNDTSSSSRLSTFLNSQNNSQIQNQIKSQQKYYKFKAKYSSKIFKLFNKKKSNGLRQIQQVVKHIFKQKSIIANIFQYNAIQSGNKTKNQQQLNKNNSSDQQQSNNKSIDQKKKKQRFSNQYMKKSFSSFTLPKTKINSLIKIQQINQSKLNEKKRKISQKSDTSDKSYKNYKQKNQRTSKTQSMYSQKSVQNYLTPQLLNSPNIRFRSRKKNQSLRESNEYSLNNQRQSIRVSQQIQSLLPYLPGDNLKGIQNDQFYFEYYKELAQKIKQCYNKIKFYSLVKTNNLNLIQQILAIKQQNKTYDFIETYMNSYQYDQFQNDQQLQFYSTSTFNRNKIIKPTITNRNKVNSLNLQQSLINRQLFKYTLRLKYLIQQYHKNELNISKNINQQTQQKDLFNSQSVKKLLIIPLFSNSFINQFQKQKFIKPLFATQLHSEFIRTKNVLSTYIQVIDNMKILTLKCYRFQKDKNIMNKKSQQQKNHYKSSRFSGNLANKYVQNQRQTEPLCKYCHPQLYLNKIQSNSQRKSNIFINQSSTPILLISLHNKTFELHVFSSKIDQSNKSKPSQKIQTKGKSSRGPKLSLRLTRPLQIGNELLQQPQKNTIILNLKLNGINIPVAITCPYLLEQLMNNKY